MAKYSIRDDQGYISRYDYKTIRETLPCRHRTWANLANVERYLQTDSYRRLARHTRSDLVIEEVGVATPNPVVRTIPLAEVEAAAALASRREDRLARGLKR